MAAGPPPDFSFAVDERDGRIVVEVRGELDLATASELEEQTLAPAREGRHVVLDLRELEFMDSSGVRVIVTTHQAAQDGGGRLTVLPGPPGSAVLRVLEVSGLVGVLELAESTDG